MQPCATGLYTNRNELHEIEKEVASNNNNISSFKNKWSPLKLSSSDKLLVFSVTPFKVDQNKNQNRSIDKIQNLGNKKEGNMQRPSPKFRPEDYFVYEISEEIFSQN